MTPVDLAELGSPERIRAIAKYDLFDTDLRDRLNALCERTAATLGTHSAMVSIVLDSAQFFVGSWGVSGWVAAAEGTPAEWAFCAHATLGEQRLYVIPDATADPRHRDSPLVTQEGIQAYAGTQLIDDDGEVLGTHCVTAPAPRQFTEDELRTLDAASAEALTILDGYRVTVASPAA